MTREEMLKDLSSDWVETAAQLAIKDYETLFAWLQPMFTSILEEEYPTDEELADFYETQLGEAP